MKSRLFLLLAISLVAALAFGYEAFAGNNPDADNNHVIATPYSVYIPEHHPGIQVPCEDNTTIFNFDIFPQAHQNLFRLQFQAYGGGSASFGGNGQVVEVTIPYSLTWRDYTLDLHDYRPGPEFYEFIAFGDSCSSGHVLIIGPANVHSN